MPIVNRVADLLPEISAWRQGSPASCRQPSGPRSVDTVMIRGADHMYSGEEEQVARTIAT